MARLTSQFGKTLPAIPREAASLILR